MRATVTFCVVTAVVCAVPLCAYGGITAGFWYDPEESLEASAGGYGWAGGCVCNGCDVDDLYPSIDDTLPPGACDPDDLGSCFGNYMSNSAELSGSGTYTCPNPPPGGSASGSVGWTIGYALNGLSWCIAFDTDHLSEGSGHAWADEGTEAAGGYGVSAGLAAYVPFWVTEAGYLFVEKSYLSALGNASAHPEDQVGAVADWSVMGTGVNTDDASDDFDVCLGPLAFYINWPCDKTLDQRDSNRPRCIPILAGPYEFWASLGSIGQCMASTAHFPVGDNAVLADFHFNVTLRYLHNPFQCADMNNDGSVNFGDINPFVLALQGDAAFYQRYPNGIWTAGDINEDGFVDFDDLNPFIDCVVNGGCPECGLAWQCE
jgi:hypothetical protein